MMNAFSAIIRIICGIATIVLSTTTYNRNREHIAAGEAPQIFGHVTTFTGWQLTLAFSIFGLLGLVFIIVGVAKLIRSPN